MKKRVLVVFNVISLNAAFALSNVILRSECRAAQFVRTRKNVRVPVTPDRLANPI